MNTEKISLIITGLAALGPLPSEDGADPELMLKYDNLIRMINTPITDDEARILINLLGSDGCFGLASSIMHLIETAPGWPLMDCLSDPDNDWKYELYNRAVRGGRVSKQP